MKNKINLLYPTIFKDEWIKALSNTFETRWLGQGPQVDLFEKRFGDKFGYEFCLATNSGTSSLELAYELIGLKEGDEVITTVFTCTATNIPLIRRNVKIIFADICKNLTIDFEDVKRKVTTKTKAIVVVTLGGLPIDNRIFEFSKENKIPIVVDAAQSLGVSEKYGDYVCYSFQAIKHFTTGDGGMLIVRNEEEYNRAKKLRWFGIDREAKRRVDFNCLNNREITMEIEEPGYKYHMNDIAATMGLVGLEHSDEILFKRKSIYNWYVKYLNKDIEHVCGGSYWLFAIFVENRDDLIDFLRKNEVECDLIQLRNDIFKIFGGKRLNLTNMNDIEKKYLYLPFHTNLTEENVINISSLVNENLSVRS